MQHHIDLDEVDLDLTPHLFEYPYDGKEWELTIMASSQREAEERLARLPLAEYKGEILQTIRILPNQIAFGVVLGLGLGLLIAALL